MCYIESKNYKGAYTIMNAFFKFTEIKASECEVYKLSKKLEKTEPNVSELDKPIANEIAKKNAENGKGVQNPEAKSNPEKEKELEEVVSKYIDDLKSKSECPDTIPNELFKASELKKISPEENAEKRKEFQKPEVKFKLKREWEQQNGRPWPRYERDIYSANGKLIRKAGMEYDVHHIQPLGMGGKNEVSNITPLSAEVHYDKQGVHSPESQYSKLNKMLGGM